MNGLGPEAELAERLSELTTAYLSAKKLVPSEQHLELKRVFEREHRRTVDHFTSEQVQAP